jgi:hypothetical protein
MPQGESGMTLRRLFVGLTVVFGLSVWSWCRADGNPAQAAPADGRSVAAAAGEDAGDGNHDEAARRFRSSQSHHWRHVMIGTR